MSDIDIERDIGFIDDLVWRHHDGEFCHLAENGRKWLKEIRRLRGECDTLRRQWNELDQRNEQRHREWNERNVALQDENQRLRDGLVDEARRCSVLRDEAGTVLRLMDGLAEQWGDEAVFRRCRDRLRAAVEAAQEAPDATDA